MLIDINSDVGESYGNYQYGNDAENMAYLSSINIACGLHAGDPLVIRQTVELAAERNIAIGAHPGFPDRQGFGRRKMDLKPEEAKNFVIYQIAALDGFVRIAGKKLTHVDRENPGERRWRYFFRLPAQRSAASPEDRRREDRRRY